MTLDVIHETDGAAGWAPIDHLADLAARLCGGARMVLPMGHMSRGARWLSLRARPAPRRDRALLAILRSPASLYYLRRAPAFRAGYGAVAVWIVDGFHTDLFPNPRAFRDLDFLGYMRPNDEAAFRAVAGDRAHLIGWGADVLALGTGKPDRPVDVQRVGRQPPAWDDDVASAAACAAAGLRFSGRTPFEADPLSNQRRIMAAYGDARFVLAHSNRADPSAYTHAHQEYITARWTDALACGAVVAGQQPHGDASMAAFLWPGATLDFDRIDLAHNVTALAEARSGWSAASARRNHRLALERLDWRWRLKTVAQALGLTLPGLEADLERIGGPKNR